MNKPSGATPLPATLVARALILFNFIATWLDALLAPLEAEPQFALAPVLVPARVSTTRLRRTTAARIYQRRRLATRIAFALRERARTVQEEVHVYPHKWAERVSKRRQPTAAAAASAQPEIRFSATSSSRPLISAPRTVRRPGADTFSRQGRSSFQNLPLGGLHAAAFIPRPMTG